MKQRLIKYFDLTRSELNGLLVLFFLIAAISALPALYQQFMPVETPSSKEHIAIKALTVTVSTLRNTRNVFEKTNGTTVGTRKLFKFDPNTVTVAEWQKLGLSFKQAQSINNYKNKGGKFFKPEDLQKMYTIKPALYQQLLPFVEIKPVVPFANPHTFDKANQYKKTTFAIVDINIADTIALDGIKGIGAAFARRIVAYREKLGGFYQTAQLMEVYGIDSVKYDEIKNQVKIVSGIKKIDINSATFDELKNHPYLRYKQINAIIQYRKQHGRFGDADALRKILLLDDKTIEKITPYLVFK